MKKILSLLLVLCVLTGTMFCTAASSDTAAENAARALYDMGLFLGTGTDASGRPVFELDKGMTRCEAAAMIVRLLGGETQAMRENLSTPFTDVPEWAEPYVGYAYSRGLTKGVSASSFGSRSNVTLSQYLTFVLRALGYDSGIDFEWDSAWILTDTLGITNGDNGRSNNFTRADAVQISYKALGVRLKGSFHTLKEKLDCTAKTPPVLEIHFIDVGEADAALLMCGGEAMMIDGGNAADSDTVYTYLKKYSVDHLKYLICTHPHEDHVGGLSGALNYATVGTVFCSEKSWPGRPFESFVKYVEKRGAMITVPTAGAAISLGGATGTILGPITRSNDANDNSLVVRITYGDTSFLFAADACAAEEMDIIGSGSTLGSTVLKVGHHGSESSSSEEFLKAVSPEYAVISVGEGNNYSHPSGAVLDRLEAIGATVFRTDLNGDIICRSDSKTVSFSVSRSPISSGSGSTDRSGDGTGAVIPGDADYVLNMNSGVFHRPWCSSVSKMSGKNKLFFNGTREEVVTLGYRPCGICRP